MQRMFISGCQIIWIPVGGELLKNLDKIEGDIDLFILDIEMPGRDGLWLRKELERYRYGSSIIYLTSHDELVQEAFGRYVIGLLIKSVL